MYQGHRRAFGGLNVVFCGDFWQLTPVKNISIFNNPFLKGYSAPEQKIFKMFWHTKDKDSIQQTFTLTKPLRTEDPWLQAVLEMDRYGNESWEVYCFAHGLPTRNPGSWDPRTGKVTCGCESCESLAETAWKTLLYRVAAETRGVKKESWLRRLQQECQQCSDERQRRICILQNDNMDDGKHLKPPFDAAPFVHPFRHPSYHATQLRALIFARNANTRLLWFVAHDKELSKLHKSSEEQHERRKERWLEFHDRFTAGIPGIIPLVVGMTYRFTDTVNKEAREAGVFKHARGILRGLILDSEEQERLENLDDMETVLQQRPKKLILEIENGGKQLLLDNDKRLYILPLQWKTWSLDKDGAIRIKRCGFPLVPDFGGTGCS